MRSQSLFLTATAVSAASAWRTQVIGADAPSSRAVSLACIECRPAIHASAEEPIPSLLLNFSVADTAPYNILLNGATLYPQASPIPDPLFAPVTRAGDDHASMQVRLGYELGVERSRWFYPAKMADTTLSFSVVQVAGEFTQQPQTVQVKFLTTPDSKPHLLHDLVVNPSLTPAIGSGEAEKTAKLGQGACSRVPLFCKVKAALKAKVATFRRPHCHHKAKLASAKLASVDASKGYSSAPPSHGLPPQRHRAQRLVRKLLTHILLPMLIGIAAGLTASMLGMIIGQLVVLLWRRLYRGHNGGLDADDECECDDGVDQRYVPLLFRIHSRRRIEYAPLPGSDDKMAPAPSYEEATAEGVVPPYTDEKAPLVEAEERDM